MSVPPPTPEHDRGRRCAPALRALLRRLPEAGLAVCVLALVVRFTVRDTVPWVAVIHHAGRPLLVGLLAVGVAVFAALRRRRGLLACAAVIALAGATVHGCTGFVAGSPVPAGAGTVHAVLWNVAHGAGGWQDVADALQERGADLVLLVEAGDGSEGEDALLRAALPGHGLLRTRGGFVVLCRGRAELLGYVPLTGRGRAVVLRLEVDGTAVHAVLVDVAARLRGDRGPSLRKVLGLGDALPEGPALLLGDFNTPRDSVFLDPWRDGWTHAQEAAGQGSDATWPMPLPFLSLDQVWGRGVAFGGCTLVRTWASDHLLVAFEFDAP